MNFKLLELILQQPLETKHSNWQRSVIKFLLMKEIQKDLKFYKVESLRLQRKTQKLNAITKIFLALKFQRMTK